MRARFTATVLAAFAAAFGLALTLTLADAWREPSRGLLDAVGEALPASRVANPVTAVLLDYRGYDTLLELGVLLLAWLGATGAAGRVARAPEPGAPAIARSLGRLLLAPMILVAGYLLWAGADAPGGAFQAGAIGGAAAVTWRLCDARARPLPAQSLLAPLGLATFLAVALGARVFTGVFLDYPHFAVRELMLLVELGAAVSVAVILAALFDAVRGAGPGEGR